MTISFSLDKKLVLLVTIVSVTALSITAYLSFNYADQILRERTGDQLISESTVRGDSIRILFQTRIKETQILATDPMIQILVSELNDAKPDELSSKIDEKRRAFLTQVQAFQELVGFSIGLEDVKIIGKDGIAYFSLGRIINNDFSNDPLFKQGLSEGFVDFESVSGEKKMVVTTPILPKNAKRDAPPIGVVIAKMRTEALDEILLNQSGLGDTGEVYIVNNNFILISESRFIESAIFNQKVETLPVKKCFEEGTELIGFYEDYHSVSIYGSSYCAKDLGFVLLAEIDEAETVKPIIILQDRIFQTGLAITAVMIAIAFVLSKSMSRPLIKLRDAANEIAKGNFEVRTNIKSTDEIGELSSSFDSMAQKLRESLFEIKQKDRVIKQQEQILLNFADHSENVCVCLIDIKESTRITAPLTDSQSSKLYSIFLNSMAEIVRNHNGIVVKNIGDALLFYFPQIQESETEKFRNVLECCLKMTEAHDQLNKRLAKEGLPQIDYKISATYGSVRVARIAKSDVNDIFGSTVNRCAKINPLSPRNGLVIGDAFYQNAKSLNDFNFEKLDQEVPNEFGLTIYAATRTKKEEKPQEILGGRN